MVRALICIGCDEYDHIGNISGAQKDASSMFEVLLDENIGAYDKDASCLLFSPDLTTLRSSLSRILFMNGPIDTFTFFYAGHGGVRTGAYYLTTKESDGRMLSATAFGISELFARINEAQPKQSNIIIDACHGGGVVVDLHALLKPEIIGGSQMPGVTIFATSASDEESMGTIEGGIGTNALLACLTGSHIVQTSRPSLDLVEVGKAAASIVPAEEGQTPVLWGLNLYGEARFSKNLHYEKGVPSVLHSLSSFSIGTSHYEAIKSNATNIWKEYFSADEFYPIRFLARIAPTTRSLSSDPDALALFVKGMFDAFSARASDSSDIFCEIELKATCIVALLQVSGQSAYVDHMIMAMAEDLTASLRAALIEVFDQIKKNRYALLNRRGVFSDFHYLPLRVTRILGWIGASHSIEKIVNGGEGFDENGLRNLVQILIDYYRGCLVVVSDDQAPYLLTILQCCVERGWREEGEEIFGMLSHSYFSCKGRIAISGIDAARLYEFTLRRAAEDFTDGRELLAQPDEVLPVLLMASEMLGYQEVMDHDLNLLDHKNLNIFIPRSHKDFGQVTIEEGINHTAQIGHGVWNVADFIADWKKSCEPMFNVDPSLEIPSTRVAAILAAMLFPDRCPWFLVTTAA